MTTPQTDDNSFDALSTLAQTLKESNVQPMPVHIVGICGSMRGPRSFTRKTMQIALDAAQEAGATVDLIDLSTLALPFCSGPEDRDDHPATVDLRRRVSAGQGILLGSPEYHNSYSGVLKNALDLLGSDECRGRIFGLLGVAGGSAGAINTLGHLRVIVRGVGGWSLPVQISIPQVSKAFDGDRLVDKDIDQRLHTFGREMVRFSRLHALVPHLSQVLLTDVIDENIG